MRTILISLLLLTITLSSIIIEVNLDGSGDYTEIQAGIDAAAHGDTIMVYPGTYVENISFDGKLITLASLYITTEDRSYIHNTIIDGNQNGSVVLFDETGETNDAVLCGFTITNGSGNEINTPFYYSYGGGIFIKESSPTLKNLIIENNNATIAGGIHCRTSESYLEDITIRYNHACLYGGGFYYWHVPTNEDSDLTFSTENRCNIYYNYAGDGNDIYVPETYEGLVEIYVDTLSVYDYDYHFVSNFPNLNLDVQHGKYEQVNCDLYVNPEGSDQNTGFTAEDPLQTLHWALARIKSDSLNPKSIYLAPGVYSASENNQYFRINGKSHVSIIGAGKDETVFDGENTYGLFFFRDDIDCYLSDLSFTNGYSSIGCGIYSRRSDLEIQNIKISNCTSFSAGGIYLAGGYIEGNKIEILNNIGTQAIGISKYFDVDASCYFNNLIVAGNEPYYEEDRSGGAILINLCTEAIFTNSLIIDNTTFGDMWPIPNVSIYETENIYFINSTICNNHSNYGGGVGFMGPGSLYLLNSIIYDNEPYEFILKRSEEPGYIHFDYTNIDEQNDFLLIAGPEPYAPEIIWGEGYIREDPQFVGGDEADPLYYQLSEDSPCINTGTPDTTGLNLPEYDLLGNPRIWNDRIDMGCYEYYVESGENPILPPANGIWMNNYPNPFNPETAIQFSIPADSYVELAIFNLRGQKVRNLIYAYLQRGNHTITWDGKDEENQNVPSEIYLYQLKTGDELITRRMLLLK